MGGSRGQPTLSPSLVERVQAVTSGRVAAHQCDVRELLLPDQSVDIILAAAVLHHLRSESQWRDVFARFAKLLRPGGSVWIFDLVAAVPCSVLPSDARCFYRASIVAVYRAWTVLAYMAIYLAAATWLSSFSPMFIFK